MGGREGLELFRDGNLAGTSSSWASCVTTPPVASRFLLPWLSPGETGESNVSSSLRLSTHPLLRRFRTASTRFQPNNSALKGRRRSGKRGRRRGFTAGEKMREH